MPLEPLTRRGFLAQASTTPFATAVIADDGLQLRHLATNSYPWGTFYRREGKNWEENLEANLAEVVKAGLDGYEPGLSNPEQVMRLLPLLKQHGLEMRSVYMNVLLHDTTKAEAAITNAVKTLEACAGVGTRIAVINPTPLRWGGNENKTDAQLILQANNLNALGRALRQRNITLAYHNHDAEMRKSAREFHHMMLGTDPENVHLCLDAHWIFRGAGDSSVALFDCIKLYTDRIVEFHLRQSRAGIWQETFGTGDIDYTRVRDMSPEQVHVVLEQAVEAKSPKTLGATTAHRQSVAAVRKIFG